MSSKGPGLIDLPADRLAPRRVDAEPPAKAGDAGTGKRAAAGRAGKTMIGAYIDKGDLYTVQELLLRLSRDRGERVTMQEAIVEALTDLCAKHGVKLSGK